MIRAALIGEEGSSLELSFAAGPPEGDGWARCEVAAEAEDGETWTASQFRLSRQDGFALQALCRAKPGDSAHDQPFESELHTWLVSRWADDGTVVLEIGLRSEASAERGEDEGDSDGLDLMIRTTSPALIAFGDDVAAGVEFAVGGGREPGAR